MRRACLVLLALLVLLMQIRLVAQDQVNSGILDVLNVERERAGLNNLYMNSALVQAAQRHSNDMAQGGFLSHIGSDSSEFWERMADAGYVMTSGAENVQSRNDLSIQGAFDLWWNSPTHNANMMNLTYVEIGIAYAQSASGTYYFTMLLASRADFSVPQVTQNAPTLTIAPPTLPVAPTQLPASTSVPLASVTPTLTSISPTFTPTVDSDIVAMNEIRLQGLLSLLIAQANAVDDLVQPTPTQIVVQQATFAPPTPSPEPQFEVRLVYDVDSFTLINNSDRPLYVEGLYFESSAGGLEIGRWSTQFLSASLTQFPAGGCLQVWGLGYSSPLLPPPECRIRHGWIAVNESATFWQGTTSFDVYLFGEWVTTCTVVGGECLFNLTDRVNVVETGGTSVQTNQQGTNYPSDMRLIYSQDSFSILNTSGNDLDMTGLGFASASGTVSINQWNTQFLSRPLNAFPSGDCLQAWSLNLAEYPPRPTECSFRHAWIGLADSQLFWMNTDFFTVSRGGAVLATCNVNAGVCDVDLP